MTQPLPNWATELLAALEIDPVNVDRDALDDISNHIDDDPGDARLFVGFVAGYAAGLAQGSEMASFERAHGASVQFMRKYLTGE